MDVRQYDEIIDFILRWKANVFGLLKEEMEDLYDKIQKDEDAGEIDVVIIEADKSIKEIERYDRLIRALRYLRDVKLIGKKQGS
ncbi:MAG: hypothetical protein ACTSRC_12065 [Candidatus Helarchaeota archaeon]